MGTTHLAVIGKREVALARSVLSVQQIDYAEWLAVPTSERNPGTQKELAKILGVTEETLCHWKQIPELWVVRDDALTPQQKELVSDAIGVLRTALKSKNNLVAFRAAVDVLDRFGESRKHVSAVVNIVDMYKNYHGDN